MNNFAFIDILVFIKYIFIVIVVGLAFNKKSVIWKRIF